MSGIYIHIPFCDTKCVYCDFYSITDHSRKSELIRCIVKEMQLRSSGFENTVFDTVYIGGGTPSLLSFGELNSIFEAVYSNFRISSSPEISIEANPGTLRPGKLKELRSLPVNRLSFGVQSFVDKELKFLTRIHSAEEAVNAVRSAQDSGYDNINIDLIFGLPSQSLDTWKHSLETAAALGTQHISAYSLIFEEGTPLIELFKKGNVIRAGEDLELEMFASAGSFLSQNGFKQYEISSYAKEGFECRHNLNYWAHQEYFGFGPSAASFLGNKRSVNVRDTGRYIELINGGGDAFSFTEEIDAGRSITENIFLGLRSTGISIDNFKVKYNIDFLERYGKEIETLVTGGFALLSAGKLSLTPKGYALCDEIAARYF